MNAFLPIHALVRIKRMYNIYIITIVKLLKCLNKKFSRCLKLDSLQIIYANALIDSTHLICSIFSLI